MTGKGNSSGSNSKKELQKKKARTGIDKLDEMLGGGLPRNSTTVIMGPPGVGKSTFVNQYMNTGGFLKEKELYITMDMMPAEIKETGDSFGFKLGKLEKAKRLKFIDSYSWRAGGVDEKDGSEMVVQSPPSNLNLNSLNMTLNKGLKSLGKGFKRIGVDSVSTLFLYTKNSSSAIKFLQTLGAKAKKTHSNLVLVVEEGVHDEKTINTLNYVADGTIKMKMEGDERFLKIERMSQVQHSREWKKFEITDEGIEMI